MSLEDTIRGLFPGVTDEHVARVVDVLAHGEPSCSPRSGTSSAGGSGQRPPAAPSTKTRQAAQDGQSGSGGDATDGVPAHQPTPQVGDVWEHPEKGRYRLVRINLDGWYPHHIESVSAPRDEQIVDLDGDEDPWRLVERDGQPWPPAPSGADMIAAERLRQVTAEGWTPEHDEQHTEGELANAALCYLDHEVGFAAGLWPWGIESWRPTPDDRVRDLVKAGALVAAEIDRLRPGALNDATPSPVASVGVEPATDNLIAAMEETAARGLAFFTRYDMRSVIARVRQEQARGEGAERHAKVAVKRRNEAQAEVRVHRERYDGALARIEAAEASVARVEQVTAAERAVIDAALHEREACDAWHDETGPYSAYREANERYRLAVRALRDAQEAGQ